MIDATYRYAKCRGCFASEKPVFNVSDCRVLSYIGSYPEYDNVEIGPDVYYKRTVRFRHIKSPNIRLH